METMRDWRRHGGGPPCARLGRELRFTPADVEAWFEEQKALQATARSA